MLSKEEIEKAKKKVKLLSIGDFVTWFTTDRIVEMGIAIKTLLQYIQELEVSNKELDKENNRLEKIELERDKANKMIDEMANSFFKLYQKIPGTMHKFFENGKPCEYGYDKENNECKEINCKSCIKQYFEKKVEEK